MGESRIFCPITRLHQDCILVDDLRMLPTRIDKGRELFSYFFHNFSHFICSVLFDCFLFHSFDLKKKSSSSISLTFLWLFTHFDEMCVVKILETIYDHFCRHEMYTK